MISTGTLFQGRHAEAETRGLPNLADSVQAIPRLGTKKAIDLFAKYAVLQEHEMKSRIHAALDRYAKKLLIESESMVLIGRQMIMPAALRHQKEMAEAVESTVSAVSAAKIKNRPSCNSSISSIGSTRA